LIVGVLENMQEVQLLGRLRALEQQHRELDRQISELESGGAADQLQLRRLKKLKLALKDQILMVEAMIIPDIIA
jgi:hypothetical protein